MATPRPTAPSPAALERALARERARRTAAETQLEDRSRELYESAEALRRNHKRMMAAEKMASLGVLSAGVAHEINTPVGYVTSNVRSLEDYLLTLGKAFNLLRAHLVAHPDGDSAQSAADYLQQHAVAELLDDTTELVEETREGLERVSSIVAGLRTFARADEGAFERIDVADCVTSALTLAQSRTRDMQLHVVIHEALIVTGNAGRLGQVILNLLVNACQACEAGTVIRVGASRCGDDVVVLVADEGPGIAQEHVDALFTPFFTTKAAGEGTGLGLSISHGIVEEHGGRIEVETELGAGSTFRVLLPVAGMTDRES